MIYFKSFTSFYNFIEEIKKDKIQYKIMGHSYEDFTDFYTGPSKPANNKWFIKLLLVSSIGSFYCSEVIMFEDNDKITSIKAKLATLKITHQEIEYKDGIVLIN